MRADMCNAHGMMHGGCSAYLVDQSVPPPLRWPVGRTLSLARSCTSVALIVQALVIEGSLDLVSQSLSTTYHAGATL